MAEMFFTGGKAPMETGSRPSSNNITLLSGPPTCGKTSLLFQFAINSALSCSDRKVVFICSRRRMESNPPHLSQGIDPSSDVFDRIQMKYVEDDEDIKRYLAAFHLLDAFPAAVVIDDFGDFLDERVCQERYSNARGRDLAMAKILALAHNALSLANEKGRCEFVISDTHHGESPRLLFIYKRWVSSIFTVKADGRGWFLLTSSDGGISSGRTTAKYSIMLQYLCLEGMITEDDESQQQ
ncbi:unnamed protein product [Linum trigynum]|uniref:Uncharacterized protein n=1 Tax=Linum trigynum TaxID=586398 RepID=A0AAV2CH92_9ROSI